MMQITYQRKDGCIIQRQRNTMLPYKIGETTSMGWKVLNIEYEYQGKFYSEYEYNKIMHNRRLEAIKKRQTKELCEEELKKFMYYFIAAIIVNFLKSMIGI